VVLLAALAALTAAAPTERDADLEAALQVIETAFRAGDADALRPVLPEGSKILLDLESHSRPSAYYSPEQIVLIFGKLFHQMHVLRFHLHREHGGASGARLHYVPAEWSGRDDRGGVHETRLQFMLAREDDDTYRIREIKEVR
jgi:hypothetical protein